MRRALQLARTGVRGANPLVGAVILAPDGQVLAEGAHHGAGTAHAEAAALAQARARGVDVRGATCVVTLEPCRHQGRTPACTSALIRAGVGRVLYGIPDPNPEAGGGAILLREAGIEAAPWPSPLADEARALNRRWLRAQDEHRPFVTAKTAQTLDGFAAAPDGTSQWITGDEARASAHELRSRVDAIAVGTGTALADDPLLTARGPGRSAGERQPLRVAIGLRSVPDGARMRGDLFVHLATRDLVAALADLHDRGVRHLLIDGGPTLVGAALTADLVDDLLVHTAPAVLGAGRPAIAGLAPATLADRLLLEPDGDPVRIGADLVCHYTPLDSAGLATPSGPAASVPADSGREPGAASAPAPHPEGKH